jgi:hypothetical protein
MLMAWALNQEEGAGFRFGREYQTHTLDLLWLEKLICKPLRDSSVMCRGEPLRPER